MHIHSTNKRRGTALVFLLMAAIAVLALLVVYLSRAGRAPASAVEPQQQLSPAAAATDSETSASLEPGIIPDSPTTSTPPESSLPTAPINIPPPPPPINTPDARDLPPEG